MDIDVNGFAAGHDRQQPREDRLYRRGLQGAARSDGAGSDLRSVHGRAGGKANESGGSHGKYKIVKFAAFTVTGYKTSGSDDTYIGSSSPSFKGNKTGDCDNSGKCRGLRGYFVRYVDLGEEFELGTAPTAA